MLNATRNTCKDTRQREQAQKARPFLRGLEAKAKTLSQPAYCPDLRLANTPIYHLIPPADINMLIPEVIKKCVVFVGVESTKGGSSPVHWGGTGFFVMLESGSLSNIHFMYLVTAGHVAKQLKGQRFFIRANTKDGHSVTFQGDDTVKWWSHPEDDAADVAVFPFPTLPEALIGRLDYSALPTTVFLNENDRAKEGIGEGNEVVIVGLFSRHAGNSKNLPLVRMGTVAMFPEERIPIRNYGNMDAYLIEARSIGGLSGSPVFVLHHPGKSRLGLHLLGLVHGHWDVGPDQIIDVTREDASSKDNINMGIAIVTPAKKIIETINRKELAAIRKDAEAKWIADNSPTPDAQMGG
jgi:hypothetical protein